MSDSTDAALAAEGDYEAFERLYRRYLSRIYSLCARLSGSPTKGVELTEEVFVRAWEKLPHFTGERGFGGWLHRLASDVGSNGLRAEERSADTGELEGATDAGNDALASTQQTGKADLAQAIDALPAAERRILVLHDVEGYKYDDIAEILGITSGVSKARLHRARVLLRKTLAQ